MNIIVRNHFFLVEVWICHNRGIGSVKITKSVATVMTPKARAAL